MRSIKTYVEGKEQLTQVPKVTLMSRSPMANVEDAEDTVETNNDISSEFNAQTHVQHFQYIFREYYGVALADWAKAAIADNTTINQKVYRLMGLPHVGCNSHKFNLDIEE